MSLIQDANSGARIRRVFPGGNTCVGFHSFYDQIIDHNATRILIIKGGPGVGKSTFMRRVADRMLEEGCRVEYNHCSSDNGSIDGVVFPDTGVALMDGTAPHVVDPRWPGCVDEIIHLGDFWNESGLRAVRREIIHRTGRVAELFRSAYRYLMAAKPVHDDWESENSRSMNWGKMNLLADSLVREYLGSREISDVPGTERHLFTAAITPDGIKNYLETILAGLRRVVVLQGAPGTGKSTVLSRLGRVAAERGFRTEFFHCPFDPSKIEHVVIDQLGIAFVTLGELYWIEIRNCDRVVDTAQLAGSGINSASGSKSRELFFELLGVAISRISEAKAIHDEIESYYVPNMDFSRIDRLNREVTERILSYSVERSSC